MKRILVVCGLSLMMSSCGAEAPLDDMEVAAVEQKLESCAGLDDHEAAFCHIGQISEVASSIASIYSSVKTAQEVLQLIGAIERPASQKERFDALERNLINIGVSLSSQIAATNRNNYLPNAIANAEQARQLATQGRRVDLGSATYRDSRADAIAAQSEVAFQRVYSGPGFLRDPFLPPGVSETGQIMYDWRLGVSELMEIIAYRIAVLSSADPEWGTNNLRSQQFDAEMNGYREQLIQHRTRMMQGVQCIIEPNCAVDCGLFCGVVGTKGPPRVQCQDVYSGYNLKYTGTCGENMHAKKHELTRQIWQKMPLFQLQKMIDVLYTYANPGPDLAQTWEQIPMQRDTSLCLHLESASTAAGTPVVVRQCDVNNWDTQWWNYDRRTGIVSNPWANKCLDVQWSSTDYGATVWTWDCTPAEVNNPAQRWTWNPATSHLVNALSPDLVLGAASAWNGSPVRTGQISFNPEFNGGQLWHAD